jgi:predicted DNA-binding transcriptional regulator AlpA
MPIIDGGIDVPALEWCSISEAVLWIECRQEPIDPRWWNHLPNRLPVFTIDSQGHFISSAGIYRDSLKILYMHLCAGTVRLRGCRIDDEYPPIGKQSSAENCILINDDRAEIVSLDNISEINHSLLIDAASTGVLRLITINDPIEKWKFINPQASFVDLIARFPPKEGQSIRIGTDIKLLDNNILNNSCRKSRSSGKDNHKYESEEFDDKISGNKNIDNILRKYNGDELLKRVEAAEYLNISVSTLEKLNSHTGPKQIKLNRSVRYRVSDLDDWIEKKKKQ